MLTVEPYLAAQNNVLQDSIGNYSGNLNKELVGYLNGSNLLVRSSKAASIEQSS